MLVHLEGCRTAGMPGAPSLPVYPACFLIPAGEVLVSVEVSSPDGDVVVSSGVFPPPVQAPSPLGRRSPGPTPPDPSIYSLSSPFPDARGELSTLQRYAGADFA
ncbi:MAG TPA: hypothetical protein VLA34_03430, partial [Candidatus Krumholzibacterium sp.]|nr:hypothetical protein [Candidatus Krumholzibacterium sp.]